MNFFAGFGKGVSSFFRAFNLVFGKGLWYYIFFPLILWLIMLLVSIYYTSELGDAIQTWIDAQIKTIPEEGHWLSWLRGFEDGWLGIIAAWIIKIILWFVSGTFMKYLTLILLSPIFSLLSEAVAVRMGDKNVPFDFNQLLKDILRGIMISLRNMLIEYILLFICFIFCSIFPPLGIILTPLMFIAGWYFIGFSMIDYSSERNKIGFIKSIRFVRSNKGLACGIGFCYAMFMKLPMIGIMFGPTMAVAGATMAFNELRDNTDAKKI